VSEGDFFFVTRNGSMWACWLSGRPAVELGPEGEVRSAMAQALGAAAPRQTSASLPPPPSPPVTRADPIPSDLVIEREKPRQELTIIGRIFTVGGSREVTIRDLSETGCHFLDLANDLKPDTRLTIKIGTIGPIEATVRWRKSRSVGIQFKTALYPSVFEHICEQFDLRKR
jgi:hypothetical protein